MAGTVEINGTVFDVPHWSSVDEFECSVGVEGIPENPLSSLISCELVCSNPVSTPIYDGRSPRLLDVYKVVFMVPYGEFRELADGIFRPVNISLLNDDNRDNEYQIFTDENKPDEVCELTSAMTVDYQLEDDGVRVSFYTDGLSGLNTVQVFVAPKESFTTDLHQFAQTADIEDFLEEGIENLETAIELSELQGKNAFEVELFNGVEYGVYTNVYDDDEDYHSFNKM